MKPLLEVRDVSLSYHTPSGETAALSHISFDLMPGEFLAVVGPSGCGKSTLLNVICGLLAPEQGSVLMNGTSVSRGDPRMGYMLRRITFWNGGPFTKMYSWDWKYAGSLPLRSCPILKKCFTPTVWTNSVLPSLSVIGGMRQRAALIRTLALKPELLLLDEPFSALDYQTRLNVSDDIGKIHKRKQARPCGNSRHFRSDQYGRPGDYSDKTPCICGKNCFHSS